MAKPTEGPGRPFAGEPVAQAGELAAIDGGAWLAQRIWHRYGSAPGVIPRAATLGLARRINRLGRQRLPLLAIMQRRWALAEGSFPHGQSGFLYAWSPGFTRLLSQSADTGQPAPALPPLRSHVATPASPAALADVQRMVVARLTDKPIHLDRSVPAQPLRQGSHPSLVQGTGAPRPTASTTRHPGAARVVLPPPTSPGDLAGMLLSRRPSAPLPPGAGTPRQAAGAGLRAGTRPSEVRGATSPGDLVVRILQRYGSGPAGHILWRQFAGPEPVHPDRRTTADHGQGSGPGVLLQPVGSEAPLSVKVRAGIPAVTSASGLGTIILRRYWDGSAERVLRRQPVLPGPTLEGHLGPGIQARGGPGTMGSSAAHLVVPRLSRGVGGAETTGTEAAAQAAPSLVYSMTAGGVEAAGAERVMRMRAYPDHGSHVDMPLVMAGPTDHLAAIQTQQESGMSPPSPSAPAAAGTQVEPGTVPAGGAAPNPTPVPETPDPEQVAQQVYAWMQRRLRLERERKGVQQWL